MKKVTLLTAFIIFVTQSFCQSTNHATSKEYYLKKSKTQKTIGWVMVGAGAALITAGIITENHNINNDPYGGLGTLDKTGPTILILAGGGVALGSIPLFISSAKNKRRGAEISFNNQPVLFPQQNVIALKMQPTFTLKISL